jgi:hypothetical protein
LIALLLAKESHVSGTHTEPVYKIHPGIGIARVGNSPDDFCISPETPAALPYACDRQGNFVLSEDGTTPAHISKFKDAEGRIKRQAARFQVFVYDEKSPEGRPLAIGDPIAGGGNRGTLVNIQWRVYLANKKACWYQFRQLEGEHGYLDGHPLRNVPITNEDARKRLIIDPGPQVVDLQLNRRAHFDRSAQANYASTFPPEDLRPCPIDTLGEILTNDAANLLVLGGHGNSGSFLSGFGEPHIDDYSNNDGWFDDTSDGPVTARLIMHSEEVGQTRYVDVEYPAWVISAYPAYVPQVLEMVTLDDVVYSTAVTQFAARTDIYGKAGTFADPQHIDPSDLNALALWQASSLAWNPDYKPWFYRDIWPILFRADEYSNLTNVLAQSNYPHNQSQRGNFDPTKLSIPPKVNRSAYARASQGAAQANSSGALFFEAVDIALTLLDDRSASAHQAHRPRLFAQAASAPDTRTELEAALRHFANIASDSTPPDEPDAYLAKWKGLYAASQSPESNIDPNYIGARDRLHAAVAAFAHGIEGRPEQATEEESNHAALLAGILPSRQAASQAQSLHNVLEQISAAYRSGSLLGEALARALSASTHDKFASYRSYLYDLLRKGGEENVFRLESRPTSRVHHLPLMPLLAGDNPLSNNLPSKFLRLTDFQLYLLRQWCEGRFFNEILEGWVPAEDIDPWQPFAKIENKTGHQLDRNVLANLAGGAFCPGAEAGWIMRNPAIYLVPYRVRADPDFSSFRQTAANENQSLNGGIPVPEQNYIAYIEFGLSLGSDYSTGLQPGDLTKMMALPWQADFNECSTQPIDVTYELWNLIDATKPDDPWMARQDSVWETLWWPAHRPMQVYELVPGTEVKPQFQYYNWARGIPQTHAGDLKMVTEWRRLGFLLRNPYKPDSWLDTPSPMPKYVSVERDLDQPKQD